MKAELINGNLVLFPSNGTEKFGIDHWIETTLKFDYGRQGEIDCPVEVETEEMLERDM